MSQAGPVHGDTQRAAFQRSQEIWSKLAGVYAVDGLPFKNSEILFEAQVTEKYQQDPGHQRRVLERAREA
jgi:hypothetical protein